MSSKNDSSSTGIGLGGGVFLVFLTLKLTDVIDWSWWWITAPLWIPMAIIVGVLMGGAAAIGIKALVSR